MNMGDFHCPPMVLAVNPSNSPTYVFNVEQSFPSVPRCGEPFVIRLKLRVSKLRCSGFSLIGREAVDPARQGWALRVRTVERLIFHHCSKT